MINLTAETTPGPEAPYDRGEARGDCLAAALDHYKIQPAVTD
jgi:hypothetical protein